MKLVIGNYNYSSWSLRVWLFLKYSDFSEDENTSTTAAVEEAANQSFQVVRIPIYTENYKAKLLHHSPAGRVPVLILPPLDGGISSSATTVWDSLAIMETVLELYPQQAVGWPSASSSPLGARAMARSIAYEMHSGFLKIRDELPQNIRARTQLDPWQDITPDCRGQIQRMNEIWTTCRQTFGTQHDDHTPDGGWLFGTTQPTIPDIMFIPVVLRFVSYGLVPITTTETGTAATRDHDLFSAESQAYVQTILQDHHVQEWTRRSKAETEVLEFIDQRIPAAQSPLIL